MRRASTMRFSIASAISTSATAACSSSFNRSSASSCGGRSASSGSVSAFSQITQSQGGPEMATKANEMVKQIAKEEREEVEAVRIALAAREEYKAAEKVLGDAKSRLVSIARERRANRA